MSAPSEVPEAQAMSLREAIIVAEIVRVHGLDRLDDVLAPERLINALAVLENAGETLLRIDAVGNAVEYDGLDAWDALDTIAGIMTRMAAP